MYIVGMYNTCVQLNRKGQSTHLRSYSLVTLGLHGQKSGGREEWDLTVNSVLLSYDRDFGGMATYGVQISGPFQTASTAAAEARGPSRKKFRTPSAEIQTEIQKSKLKSSNPL